MTNPSDFFDALDATWPPAERILRDGWVLRLGAGGGKRVSAATAQSPTADIDLAEAQMRAWGQAPLFQITEPETALDQRLAARGYSIIDPVIIYAAPVEMLLDDHPETARILRLSGPIALAEEIWAKGGIGPARIEVMRRVAGPKQWLMARIKDRPAAVGFVATAGEIAMIHAVETSQDMRRQGAGRMILQGAARFALDNGAKTLALAVTRANIPANSLYQSLGMTPATAYHYRILAEASS